MNNLPVLYRARAALDILRGKQLETDVAAGLLQSVFPSAAGAPPKRGTKELLQAYSTMPWLRAVVSKVAVAVGSTNWRLFGTKRVNATRFHRSPRLQRCNTHTERSKLFKQMAQAGELVEVEDHPLLDLLHNANPYHVGVAARRLLQVYFDLAGEFFQLLERNALGMPIAYWPVPPHWVKEIPTPKRPFFTLRIGSGSEDLHVPATEMIWAADLDPLTPYSRGSALAATLSDELETAEYASKHTKATFFNRARPDFVAWVKPGPGQDKVSQRELRRLQQRWMQEHQGFWRAFKPHFIGNELKIHEFANDLQKQSVVPVMEYERDTIIQVYGFPPEIFGILESSNRATIDAADYLFARYAVDPRLEFQRQLWQERLVPMYDARLILEYDSPVAKDKEHILNVAKAAPWAFTGDEWRDMGGHEELADEEGHIFAVPIAITLADSLAPTDLGLDLLDDGKAADAIEKRANDPSYILLHRIADKVEPRLRAGFLRAVRAMQAKVSLTALEAAIASGDAAKVVAALPWDTLVTELGDVAAASIRQVVAGVSIPVAAQLEAAAGIELGWTIENPRALQYIDATAAEFLAGAENVSRDAILQQTKRAFSEGMAPRELARKIRRNVGGTNQQIRSIEIFEDRLVAQGVSNAQIEARVGKFASAQIRKRSLSIARTETIRAANGGQRIVWQDAVSRRLLKKKAVKQRWQVTPDDRLDIEVCEPMEGQLVALGESFITGTGSAVEGPPAHPMCRCAVSMELTRKDATTFVQNILEEATV